MQRDLFNKYDQIVPTDRKLPEDALPRIGGQNRIVLERLRAGPATNFELTELGIGRPNSRIADVRRYLEQTECRSIVSQAVDTARGLYRYEIT